MAISFLLTQYSMNPLSKGIVFLRHAPSLYPSRKSMAIGRRLTVVFSNIGMDAA
jgi:hypothetical protein